MLITVSENQIDLIDKSFVVKSWQKICISEYRVLLKPISSHGFWSGKQPFAVDKCEWAGKIAAVTRARIVWRKNLIFWRAVPPVTESLHQSPGLLNAIGIGEAPIGLQGTFSIWQDTTSLRDFAYKGQAHSEAIRATSANQWYSEELFARFAAIEERGLLA